MGVSYNYRENKCVDSFRCTTFRVLNIVFLYPKLGFYLKSNPREISSRDVVAVVQTSESAYSVGFAANLTIVPVRGYLQQGINHKQ